MHNMKDSVARLDRVDYQILELVQADARVTMRELGARVGLTGPAVTERVRRLENQGVIAGYHAAVAPQRIGLGVVAYVALAIPYEFRPAGIFEQAVSHFEEVVECYRITGEDAYLLKVAVPDLDALRESLDRLGEFGRAKSTLVLSSPKRFTPLRPRPATSVVRSGAD